MSNSTPRASLPPLPESEYMGRHAELGHQWGYTAEQVEAIRRETVQACAQKAREFSKEAADAVQRLA